MYTTVQKLGVSIIFFKEINSFIEQGSTKLIKSVTFQYYFIQIK